MKTKKNLSRSAHRSKINLSTLVQPFKNTSTTIDESFDFANIPN